MKNIKFLRDLIKIYLFNSWVWFDNSFPLEVEEKPPWIYIRIYWHYNGALIYTACGLYLETIT